MAEDFHSQLIECLPHMRAFALSITRNRDRADDLVQDAVVRALGACHQFQPGTNFKAWVFTILRNQYISTLRKNKNRTVELDEEIQIGDPVAGNQEATLVLNELKRSLDRLTEEQREVIMLIGVNGLSYEQAAEVCGCPVGTIRSRLSRGRRDLLAMLLGDEDEEVAASASEDASPRRRSASQRSSERQSALL